MHRLFAGIEIPDRHRRQLGLLARPLPGARWVEPENLHLTLRYFGDVDTLTAEELSHGLAAIKAAPFDVKIVDVGAFGGREPKVIWAGIAASEALTSLHRSVERVARAAGLPPEARTFRPHVTLARLNGARSEPVARFLGNHAVLALEAFPVEDMVLFSSRPRVGGPPYVVEDRFPLRW